MLFRFFSFAKPLNSLFIFIFLLLSLVFYNYCYFSLFFIILFIFFAILLFFVFFLLKSLKSFELANSELCYGMHTAEYLACYIIFSGYEPEKTVALCGHVASAMGLENKDIYQSMLEAVSMAIAATNGIPAGDIYYKSHKSRIRYKIHEAGFLKKKLIVEELIEKGKLFQNLTEAIKQKENSFDALLRTGAGHNELVLWHSIMEYTNDERINQGVCADREKQQYAEELSHFLEKGGHDAGIDDADRNHIYKLI